MITKNYQATREGIFVASGEGVATITASTGAQWAIGSSSTTAPTVSVRHNFGPDNESMNLETGECLWVFGTAIVAVTATNAAAGDI